jgi:hypothetical protein
VEEGEVQREAKVKIHRAEVRYVTILFMPVFECCQCGKLGTGSAVRVNLSSAHPDTIAAALSEAHVSHMPIGWGSMQDGVKCSECIVKVDRRLVDGQYLTREAFIRRLTTNGWSRFDAEVQWKGASHEPS